MASPHETLYGEYCVLRVGNGLTFRCGTDKALSVLGERNHRRGGAASFRIGYNDGFTTLHDSNTRVGRAQVNSDNLAHCELLSGVQEPGRIGEVHVVTTRILLFRLILSEAGVVSAWEWQSLSK
jgi:hypothetical protein